MPKTQHPVSPKGNRVLRYLRSRVLRERQYMPARWATIVSVFGEFHALPLVIRTLDSYLAH